ALADLRLLRAVRLLLDCSPGPIDRARQCVSRLAPQQQTAPQQGPPDFHLGTTRRAVGLASSNALRFVIFVLPRRRIVRVDVRGLAFLIWRCRLRWIQEPLSRSLWLPSWSSSCSS